MISLEKKLNWWEVECMRVFLAALQKLTKNEKPPQQLTGEVEIKGTKFEIKCMIQQPLKIKID